jgi:NADPH2:quinone reductase
MRQVVVRAFGPPQVLDVTDVPEPVPAPGEVVVDIDAAHVLWVETAVRRGLGRDWFPLRPPYTPGTGVAGVEAESGRRVVAHTGVGGGYAERVVVPRDHIAMLPPEVSSLDAAALVHDATTAQALFESLAIGPQDSVLVVGASGGLGLICLQLARQRAKSVIALARDTEKIARIEALGFEVVDTERAGWADQVRDRLPDGADVVLDNVGGPLAQSVVRLLAHGGRWSAHGTPGGNFTTIDPSYLAARGQQLIGLSAVQLPLDRRITLIAQGLDLAAHGDLHAIVGQTFPLDEVAAAHEAIESRTVFGSTVLIP